MVEKRCEACPEPAVDVWVNPLYPGEVMWLCQEDLIAFEDIANHVLSGLTVVNKQ